MPKTTSSKLIEALPILFFRLGFLAAAALGAAGILITFGATWNTGSEWILRISVPIGLIITAVWVVKTVRVGSTEAADEE